MCSLVPVHPRAGGEHPRTDFGPNKRLGSSPRGRGTPNKIVHDLDKRRFIPARAGNTHGAATDSGPVPVHPRAGGEHDRFIPEHGSPRGSSPRGRGTRELFHLAADKIRFIPARAGNTLRG